VLKGRLQQTGLLFFNLWVVFAFRVIYPRRKGLKAKGSKTIDNDLLSASVEFAASWFEKHIPSKSYDAADVLSCYLILISSRDGVEARKSCSLNIDDIHNEVDRKIRCGDFKADFSWRAEQKLSE
jgi:hypothetical protein